MTAESVRSCARHAKSGNRCISQCLSAIRPELYCDFALDEILDIVILGRVDRMSTESFEAWSFSLV